MHSLDHPEKSLKLSIKTQRLEVKPFNAPQLSQEPLPVNPPICRRHGTDRSFSERSPKVDFCNGNILSAVGYHAESQKDQNHGIWQETQFTTPAT